MWYSNACPSCGGSLYDDEDDGWVTCILCNRIFRKILVKPLNKAEIIDGKKSK